MSGWRVGILVQRFDGLYQRELLDGLRREAAALGVHLLCFPGSELETDSSYWREFNASFHIAKEVALDGIVSCMWHLSAADQERFFGGFGATPMIGVGETTGDMPRIRPDNRLGMTELVDHFIHDHGFRRIAFIAGPRQNSDARERLDVFRERHAAAGLTVDEGLIVDGEFDNLLARRAVRGLLVSGVRPEAIIAANDEMGLGAIAALLEQGLQVPRDVAVAGFDDLATRLPDAPPLTSVSQDASGQAALALRMLVAKLDESEAITQETVVPTRLVLRASCGCSGRAMHGARGALWASPARAERDLAMLRTAAAAEETGEAGRVHQVLEQAMAGARSERHALGDLRQILQAVLVERLEAERSEGRLPGPGTRALIAAPFWLDEQERMVATGDTLERVFPAWRLSRILVTRMSSDAFSLSGMTRFLADGLLALGVRNAYLALYPRVGSVHRWDDCDIPSEAQLVLAIREGEVLSTAGFERFRVADLLPMPVFHQTGHALYDVLPLFQQREHYGYLVMDMTKEYSVGVEQLREAMSNLVSSVMVVGELDRARERLHQDLDRAQASNEQLAMLAEEDVLTGLLNRRGFFARAQVLGAARQGALLLISVDLDGLKHINDTWGHAAGDAAICAMAAVLRQSFRPTDFVARFGGDEFAVIARAVSRGAEVQLRARLEAHVAAFNAGSDAPWQLSASMGFVTLATDDIRALDDHLAHADRLMYAHKRQHKLLEPAPSDTSPTPTSGGEAASGDRDA